MEEVGVRETDGADARPDCWRIAALYERNRDVSSIVCPDEKPVVVPGGGDDTLYTPEIGCDDDVELGPRGFAAFRLQMMPAKALSS